jgi:HK97 family phage portal protein
MFTHIKRYLAGLLYKSYYFLVPPGESGFTHGTQFNYLNASEEGYKQVVWVYRCVNEIAKRVSSVPFVVYAEGRDGEKEEITGNHPLKSFLRKPNKLQGWAQFMRAHITLMQISGNSYWDISERIGKMPAEAWLLRPDRMLIVPGQGNDSRIARYEYTVGAQVNKVPLEDIEHWKYFDPSDDYYGLSPLYVAGSCIDTENDTNDYNKYLMRNQARPSGVLQTDTKLSDDVFKRLQSAIQGWMGAKNAGKPIILEAGLKWAQAQLSQKDSDYVNLKKLNREELCAILGVPPVLVGIMDRATYNNFSEADTILWNQTVIPELREFRDNFNMRIAPMFDDGVYIDYDLSHVEALKENEDAVHDRARKDYTGGLLKLNEARKLANQEDLPGGDFYLIPSGMTPVFGTPQAPTAIEPPAPPAEAKWHHKAYGVQLMETKSKIINLEPGQVEVYQKTFRSHQDWLIAKGAKSITPILEEYYGEVISYLKTHTDQPDAAAVAGMFYADHKKAVKAWYRDYYGKGMDYFGNLAVRDLRSSVKNHGILLTLKDDQTAWSAPCCGPR